MTQENKEIVETENLLPTELGGTWGNDDIDNDDIVLPKILLMQAMSEAVNEKGIAKPGDIIKSTTEEVMGGLDMPLEIIPLNSFKTWILSMKEGQKFIYKSTEPMTPANVTRKLEWEDDLGNEWRADKSLNFYVLLPVEIESALKGDSACIPHLVNFRRTSYMAGRNLVSGMKESAFLNQPGASRVYNLKVTKRKNDHGTFFVFDIGKGAKTTTAQLQFAKKWFDTLKTAEVKVHDTLDGEA